MRKIVFAAVALCPMLIHAQAITPAQPQSAAPSAALVSKLTKPEAPGSAAAVPTKATLKISTGVTFPKLIESSAVIENNSWQWSPNETSKVAVVRVLVSPTGAPASVQVIKSLGAAMDKDVIASVSQFRFKPASLDNEAIPVEIDLTVRIINRSQAGFITE